MNKNYICISVAIFCVTTIIFSTIYTPQAILPILQKTFNTSVSETNLLLSAMLCMLMLCTPWYAPLSNRIGKKRTMLFACLLLIIPTLLSALAPSFGWLLANRLLQAMFIPGVTAVMIAYIHDIYPKKHVGFAMGIYMAATSLGAVLGRLFAGLITHWFSWRIAFFLFASMIFIGVLIMFFLMPNDQNHNKNKITPWKWKSITICLSDPNMISVLIVPSVVFFSFMAISTFSTYYLSGPPFNLNSGQLGSVFLVLLLGVIVSPIAGKLSDRIGRIKIIFIGIGILIAGAFLTLVPHYICVITGLGLVTMGMYTVQSVAPTYIGDLATDNKSTAAILYQMFFYFGGAVGTCLPALVWSRYNYLGVVIICIGVTLVGIIPLAYVMQEKISISIAKG